MASVRAVASGLRTTPAKRGPGTACVISSPGNSVRVRPSRSSLLTLRGHVVERGRVHDLSADRCRVVPQAEDLGSFRGRPAGKRHLDVPGSMSAGSPTLRLAGRIVRGGVCAAMRVRTASPARVQEEVGSPTGSRCSAQLCQPDGNRLDEKPVPVTDEALHAEVVEFLTTP